MAKRTTKKADSRQPTAAAQPIATEQLLAVIVRVSGQGKAQARRTLAKLDHKTQTKILRLAKQPASGNQIRQLLP